MQKTIGGDRLGSGKKMQVNLRNYERSTHDLGYTWRSTMAAGTLVPFMSQVALPGDTFDIDLNADIMTHPTLGPLFGSYKVQLDVFEVPVRLYQGDLHNNMLGIGLDMSKIKLPQLELEADNLNNAQNPDNQHINPSCIFKYLGISGLGRNGGVGDTVKRKFNAIPYLGYWDIYKNYYADKQSEQGAVIHNRETTVTQSIYDISFYDEWDTQETQIRYLTKEGTPQTGQLYVYATVKVYINFDLSIGAPNPEEIKLVGASGGQTRSVYDVFQTFEIVGATLIASEPRSKYVAGNNWYNSWNYYSGTDLIENEPQVKFFPLANIDEARKVILRQTGLPNPVVIGTGITNEINFEPYNLPIGKAGDLWYKLATQEGLALKTYQSDLFNNWISTEWIDGDNGINAVTAIDTSSGSFTIDTLQLSRKVYDMLNRIAISGGSYDDWLDAVYTHERTRMAETPIYHGGLIKELVFQEVVSTAGAKNPTNENPEPLGNLAGKGVLAKKHKGGSIKVKINEPGYIIGIVSLTPRIDYSQGNNFDVNLETMNDFHKPALDEIGFQDALTEYFCWWDSSNVNGNMVYNSAGKQPAWINYMTNVNKCYGNFAIENNEMFMTLNRRYERNDNTGNIKDLTTYIDPVKFNNIFAETARDAQNFWVQIGVDCIARRKMSAKLMPNL